MANRQRGEVGHDVDGRRYCLRITFEACCQLEDLVDRNFDDVLASAGKGRLSALRAVAWCALQDSHADEITTLGEASAWIERAGGAGVVTQLLNRLFAINTEGDGSADPPVAAQVPGTGVNSTSSPVVPV